MFLLEKFVMGRFGQKITGVKNAKIKIEVQGNIIEQPDKKKMLEMFKALENHTIDRFTMRLDQPINRAKALCVLRRKGDVILQVTIEEENGSSCVEKVCENWKICEKALCLFFDFGVVDELETYEEIA